MGDIHKRINAISNFGYSKTFQGVADVFLRTPDLYRPLLEFIESVMVGRSALSKEERELIAAHVSKLNGCTFCVDSPLARRPAGPRTQRTPHSHATGDQHGLDDYMGALELSPTAR